MAVIVNRWATLYVEEAVKQAEDLVVATIGAEANPAVLTDQLLRAIPDDDERGAAILVAILASLAGIARQASSYASILERQVWAVVKDESDDDDFSGEPWQLLTGHEVDFVARCATALRTLRDTEGADTGWQFPWSETT